MASKVSISMKECCEDSASPAVQQHLFHLRPQLTYSPIPQNFLSVRCRLTGLSAPSKWLAVLQLPEAHGAEGTCKIKTRPPEASRFVFMSRLLQCIPRPKEHHQCPSDPQRCARHG